MDMCKGTQRNVSQLFIVTYNIAAITEIINSSFIKLSELLLTPSVYKMATDLMNIFKYFD